MRVKFTTVIAALVALAGTGYHVAGAGGVWDGTTYDQYSFEPK
jgi:hypothetical protein